MLRWRWGFWNAKKTAAAIASSVASLPPEWCGSRHAERVNWTLMTEVDWHYIYICDVLMCEYMLQWVTYAWNSWTTLLYMWTGGTAVKITKLAINGRQSLPALQVVYDLIICINVYSKEAIWLPIWLQKHCTVHDCICDINLFYLKSRE